MEIIKQPDGTWKLDMRVAGRDSRRVRKVFTTKSEALGYERYILKEVDDKPWLGPPKTIAAYGRSCSIGMTCMASNWSMKSHSHAVHFLAHAVRRSHRP